MMYENMDPGLNYGYDAINNGLMTAWTKSNNPIIDQTIKRAQDYGSEAKGAQLRGQAVADVSGQIAASQQATNRNLARMGIDPNSGAYAKAQAGLGLQSALAKSQALSNAQGNWEKTAFGMGMDASKLAGEQGKVNAALLTTGANVALGRDRLNKDWVTTNRKIDADVASAAASQANSAISAMAAQANAALARDRFEFDRDQTIWSRENMTPYQKSLVDQTTWSRDNLTAAQKANLDAASKDPSMAQQIASWAAAGKSAKEIYGLYKQVFPDQTSTTVTTPEGRQYTEAIPSGAPAASAAAPASASNVATANTVDSGAGAGSPEEYTQAQWDWYE